MKLIGIDIGGTKCSVVTGDETGRVTGKTKFETRGCAETLSLIFDAVSAAGTADAVGISCGGPLDEKAGVILSPPNLPGWDNVPIRDMIEERFGIKCAIKNDADACAVAEWKYGAGKGTDNMVFLTFGTGMGAGLIINGAPYSGTNGNAGEAGHIRLAAKGPVGYNKAGSFEGFCSGGGIKQLGVSAAKKLFAKGAPGPAFCENEDGLPFVTAKSIAEAAYKGDKTAINIYRKSARCLGSGISVIIDLLNPEAVVIGGIYPRCTDLMQKEMMKVIKKEALSFSASVCRVVPAYFGDDIGDVAALSVAACLAPRR
ncbi:MAG: ROK family protein [Clostridia bacterium]|nr:ROK family protein [Clostridia bacterium]